MNIKGVRTAIVITAFFALFPFPAHAESKKSTDYKNCMENVDLGALKNSQWASCAEQERIRQEAVLSSEFHKLRQELSPKQNNLLTKAQHSWLEFRENWCRLEENGPSAPGGIASYNFCMLEVTEKHIELIKSLQF